MKDQQKIEKLIKTQKPNLQTDGRTDDRILADSFAVMEKTQAESAGKLTSRSRSLKPKLAAAAMIALIAGLFMITHDRNHQKDPTKSPAVAKSPAEMLTAISLKRAYRRGGIEALDKQYRKAFKILGPRPASLSVKELLTEFNGS